MPIGKKKGLRLRKKSQSDENQTFSIVLNEESRKVLENLKTKVRDDLSDEEIVHVALKTLERKVERILKRQLNRKLNKPKKSRIMREETVESGGEQRNETFFEEVRSSQRA